MATAFNVIKSLSKRGSAIVGAGCYAVALESLAYVDRVIKVGNNTDDPWLDYYEEVVKPNQGNPSVPKVFSINVQHDDSYYVCVMERLVPATSEEAEVVKVAIRNYITYSISKDEWLDIVVEHPKLVPNIPYMLHIMDEIKSRSDIEDECCYGSDWDDLYKIRKVDLHSNNIMQRENGVLVITDPWCHTDSVIENVEDVSDWAAETLNYM